MYINHRPAFGLNHDKISWCFEVLSGKLGGDASIKRGQFLDLLQRKGELFNLLTKIKLGIKSL